MLVLRSTQKEIDDVKHALTTEFKMSDLVLVSWYQGLKIPCDISAGKMSLSQSPYVKKTLDRFGMQQAKGVDISIVKQKALVHANERYQADNSAITWYQQVVGSLMYAIIKTQFDIAYTISKASQFASNSTPDHAAIVKRIFRYFRKYLSLGITFSQDKTFQLERHVDSDWNLDLNTRRSTTGSLFILARGVVSKSSKRHHSVTLFSTEAEHVAYCQVKKEAV